MEVLSPLHITDTNLNRNICQCKTQSYLEKEVESDYLNLNTYS